MLLTKQFAYFVGAAPDPYAALMRFEQLTEQILSLPERGRLADLLADRRVMHALALLLGSSAYLWEDFIRQQFQTLLPMLEPERREFTDPASLAARSETAVAAAVSADEKVAALNRFKDREAFLIDLEHVLRPSRGVQALAARLTQLAECVVATALELATASLRPQFGLPRTVGAIDTRLAVMGLGKMGGRALGYASDIDRRCWSGPAFWPWGKLGARGAQLQFRYRSGSRVRRPRSESYRRRSTGAAGVNSRARLARGAFRAFRRGCRLPGRLAAAPLRQLR